MARPRRNDIDGRVLAAWRDLLGVMPYEQITMTDIAVRAGVGKPALYLRFPTKAHLMFASGIMRSVPESLDDLGSLAEDLLPALQALVRSLHAVPREVYADQIGLAIADAEFAHRVQEAFARPALEQVMVVWYRAVDRGEVTTDVDGRTALNDLAGALIFEVMVRHGIADDAYLRDLIQRFVCGVTSR